MTRQTALDLVLRQDQNRDLAATGRITGVDIRSLSDLKVRARQEDIEQEWAELARTQAVTR